MFLIFGIRLKKLREEQGLTQQQLADLLHVGRPTIAGYETKRKEPDFEKVLWLSSFFNVSVDFLLGREEQREISAATMSDDESSQLDEKLFNLLLSLTPDEAVQARAYVQGLKDARKE